MKTIIIGKNLLVPLKTILIVHDKKKVINIKHVVFF